MEIAHLDKLEAKYNFKYPELYRQICQDGMLGINDPNFQWDEEAFEKLKENPPFLYYTHHFDLIDEEDLEDAIDNVPSIDSPKQDKEAILIPFMENMSDTFLCFCMQEGKEASIISADYAGKSKILANNLQDYIFRQFLYLIADSFVNSLRTDTHEGIENAKAMLKSHKPYLSEKQDQILCELLDKAESGYNDKDVTALSGEEINTISLNETGYSFT